MKIIFATPDGQVAAADDRLITGKGFGVFRKFLMADSEAIEAYQQMVESEAFLNPISYSEIQTSEYDGIILPGGHDKGMKSYLESNVLQEKVVEFFVNQKIIGAICHGTVLAARSIDPRTRKSVL